ncbi:O-methyltransferase [Amycolatopsis sp. YIM 10]|uniref:O-methyltransferase n=1 Tax=Amycolatopsis sp. YIM 10 TaxID=2653857 RepID=UPI00129023A3|nr:O-methyltransferase [Amycolatopsis sp. YIM 10]QFU87331.1 Putative O-methyltransferase [Amycolatopsis sp. YIM 10]
MDQQTWTAVDQYLTSTLLPPDPALTATLESSRRAGLPSIAVSPTQGKLLHLLAKMTRAKSILEIGTLGGYSTIWLARALPADGRLVTLEYEPKHAELAKANIEAAGLADRVEVKVGAALDSLPGLEGPFDLSFIDADKANNPAYFKWALEYSRPGSVIVVDNVVRGGAVVQADSTDPSIQGVRELHDLIAAEPRVDATALQTVGDKGYDGLTIALVTS